jgi:dynein heavy chain
MLLDRLYSLYTSVISTINGYADVFWVEVVSGIDHMQEQVLGFQVRLFTLSKWKVVITIH